VPLAAVDAQKNPAAPVLIIFGDTEFRRRLFKDAVCVLVEVEEVFGRDGEAC
jgi:hypothetical protein